jgi:hypothetical protein
MANNPATLAGQLQLAPWNAANWAAVAPPATNNDFYVIRLLSKRLSNNSTNGVLNAQTNMRINRLARRRTKGRIDRYIVTAVRNIRRRGNINRNGRRPRGMDDWSDIATALLDFLRTVAQPRFNIFLRNGNGGKTDANGTFRCEGRFGLPSCQYGHIGNIYWSEEDYSGLQCWEFDHQVDQDMIQQGVDAVFDQQFDRIVQDHGGGVSWIVAINNHVNISMIARQCFGEFDTANPGDGGLKVVFKACHLTTPHVHLVPNYRR